LSGEANCVYQAIHGCSRRHIEQKARAQLLDVSEKMADELLAAHSEYLPQFASTGT
jgi:alpha-galactosidase/6-phospho-beta-glucosidase family protein